jgi:hypothetical protein
MPNNSSARRDTEKKKNGPREPTPLEKQVPAESVESFLSRSSADSGFQGDDDKFSWDSVVGEAALDNSLSSFSRLSSSAEPKETRKEGRERRRKETLAKELEEESDITLSDDSINKEDSGPRKLFLSPTQYFDSKVTGALNRSGSKQKEAMERPSALMTPTQVVEAKGKEASVDVPVEAVACVVASGANTIQRDNQGHPQGSSSVFLPSPTFNMPPIEHAQALHHNLAAELLHAGSGRSPLLPSRIRHPQEPGTAVSMIAPVAARRNNLNSSLQAQADHRTMDELRLQAQADNRTVNELHDELKRFGEACQATLTEALQSEAHARAETARLRQAAAVVEREQAASRLAMIEGISEARFQIEASSSATPARATVSSAPVMDMQFCIDNLDSIRNEAGDFPLSEFSDFWAPDHPKTTPNRPNTFVPNWMVKGSNPLWGPFYDSGRTRRGADGSPEPDPNHPPYFRVSAEVLGRSLHTLKRQYVDNDEKRTTSDILQQHVHAETEYAKSKVSEAAQLTRDDRDFLMNKHQEMITASYAHLTETPRIFKETVDKHVAALQTTVQSGTSMAQNFALETEKVQRKIPSSRVVPLLKLDNKELGFVKQLKELQEEHRMQLMRYEQLKASKEGVVEQLNSARGVNRETSQVIADFEERIKFLDQDKLGLELRQVKLEKEVETLKRKRRSTPSPPPAKLAPTPTLRILHRGEKESPAAIESALSPSSLPPPKKSRNRSKRWDQPALGQGKKVPSPARTPDNVNGKRFLEQGIKDDPVLYASLNNFRNKRDVEEEIRMSSNTLGHGSKGSEEVFHRLALPHQRKVIMKANAYVEVIITDTCKYRVQGDRGTMAGSSKKIVQAYLSPSSAFGDPQ